MRVHDWAQHGLVPTLKAAENLARKTSCGLGATEADVAQKTHYHFVKQP